MDLVPVYGNPGGAQVSQDGQGAGLALEGLQASAIRIPAERQQLIGVKYTTVEWDESVADRLRTGWDRHVRRAPRRARPPAVRGMD